MTKSSEDVLLQMSEVRYKKGDGTLYVMNERVAWMAENRDTVAVSHRYADIKLQKISPEGKPKIQLQLVLHDGNSTIFQFVNRNGQQAMIADRDKVKEQLQVLLPNFKRKVDKELEEKNRILTENPNLLQLYKDLVITKVITSDEYWANYVPDFTARKEQTKQEVGVSGAFLADIKPQPDGCNGLKYNLTADVIHSIFKAFPAVKRKHFENVPSKMSESEFWTKFFQSHYFHRDRLTGGTKDIFNECGKIDEQMLRNDVKKSSGDPLLDLKQLGDVSLEEGFATITNDKNKYSNNVVHQNMIKRFNQHSIMVLKTCTDDSSEKSADTIGPVPKSSKAVNGNAAVASVEPPPQKKSKVIEHKIIYDDLENKIEEKVKDDGGHDVSKFVNLNMERYLQGPVSQVQTIDVTDEPRRFEDEQIQLIQIAETWAKNNCVPLTSTAAINVLGELSPGGDLMRGYADQSAGQIVSKEVKKELANLYLSLKELLKHFWHCFPITTKEQESKVVQMHEALQRFKMAKLVPFENRTLVTYSAVGTSLTQHCNRMLQVANTKYVTWRETKSRLTR